MIPYADFAYWGLLLYPALPTFLLAWGRRLRQVWILFVTLGMLAVQYAAEETFGSSATIREIWLVLGVGAFQCVLAATFLLLRQHSRTRVLFWCAVGLGLTPLAGSRILPMLAPQYSVGFVGISYLTFRSLDVTIGIQDGLIREVSVPTYFAYIFFFPTISAGPIDRYRRFLTDWTHSRTWREFVQDLDGAVHRIFTGFLYKFILAELIRRYWLEPAASMPGLLGITAYMYAYSLYLFFDFAGYTAFAVGVGYVFGVHTPENFHRPFLARDIRDFWNRWHISLSGWFRDHVYMRFVMAATRRRWFGNRYVASYLGFCLSMGLMGLWHGFAGQYLVYGLYHALLLIGHDLFTRWNTVHALWRDTLVWRAAGVAVTIQFVSFGFLIFSGHLSLSLFQ
jgi:membrane protein involved in D-alanine export